MSYSVNVPLPGRVHRLIQDLHPLLVGCDRVRERHTLVAKRLGDGAFSPLAERARIALRGAPAFEARITGVDRFDVPAAGPGPVVFLAVESPGLRQVHEQLCESFDPVPGIEGEDYVPHVTLSRGGDPATVERLCEYEFEPVQWTVSELHLWDATREAVARRVSLPA